MCGIAGSFKTRGAAQPLDLTRIAHRGPDASGQWTSPDGRLWLGHTRLSILDLSPAGAQPMIDPATGNVIVFNGEIYNHLTLRAALKTQHSAWRGTSDTETLLVAYRVWGKELALRLRGMFAFAIFDAAKRQLVLMRDRFGIKPIYYVQEADDLRLASEVRVLLKPGMRGPGREDFAAYLQWGACPEARLLFPEVRMLPPGHTMTVSADGAIETERYWPPVAFPIAAAGDAAAEVRRHLERAVEEHLLADVPVASFLSGGIDSSIVTALAARHTTGRLQTFSVGFSHKQFDETEIAAQVARLYRTDHHRIELNDAEVIQLVQDAVAKMDLPSVDAINTYIVARKVAEAGVKVALSGLGGDELFGGYPSFTDVPRLKRLTLLPAPLRRLLHFGGAIGRRLADLPDGDVSTLTAWRRRMWTDAMQRAAGLWAPVVGAEPPPALPDDFARISWAELTGYMRHMLLRDSDQMSMAVSLELRVPFLDHELAGYVLSLPQREKARPGRPKGLLIEACRDLLPREVHDRPKMGFVLPMALWMRGPLAAFVDEGLRTIVEREYLRDDLVRQMHGAFCAGKLHWSRVWALVVAGHYLRRHGPEVTAAIPNIARPTG